MKISEFRSGLSQLEVALRTLGGIKPAGELSNLAAALREFDDLTISELVGRLKAINLPPKLAKSAKAPKALNTAAVEKYLLLLKETAHSADAFDRTVEQIKADKSQLPTAELKELVRRFAGAVPEKTTRSAIATFMKDRRLEMRRQEGLGATIDRMFGRQ